jgi:predicted DsbA family dithiol-disulfide isomerase
MLRTRALFACASVLSACGGAATAVAPPCTDAAETEPRIVVMSLAEERFDVPTEGRPAKGAREPLVTIVEITDFECPFCSRVQPAIARILDTRPDVRLVVLENPLPMHRYAVMAAEAALAAFAQGGDDAFFRMHDALFQNQHALAPEDLVGYAERIGLDIERFTAELEAGTHRPAIVDDVEVAVSVGARGTPTFFINGRRVAGALPFEELDAIVVEELAAAEALVAQGLPRDRVYEAYREAARRGSGASEPGR